MEAAFRAWLIAHGGCSDRVTPDVADQNEQRPYITYQVISGPRDYVQEGGTDGVTTKRVQVDIWADTPAAARACRDGLHASSGMINSSMGSPPVRLQAAFVVDERSAYEPALDQAGPRLFRSSLDFQVTADV